MKTIALVSGGKDSILSMLLALRYGHESIVVVNMAPASDSTAPETTVHEIDSYSFQTVGHEVAEAMALCMQLPLRRAHIRAGQSLEQSMHYAATPDEADEVESLYRLLRDVKAEFPDAAAVTSGAILSNYQRHRVEHVCGRLQLRSLAFLWGRPAAEVLDMAAALCVRAVLVKTASIGLDPRRHLGAELQSVRPALEAAQRDFGAHAAGEGGEFETIVLDCPLFRRARLEVSAMACVMVDDNVYAPSGHARLTVAMRSKTAAEESDSRDVLRRLPSFVFPSDRMAHLPAVEAGLTLCDGEDTPPICHVRDCDGTFWECHRTTYTARDVLTLTHGEGEGETLASAMAALLKAGQEAFLLVVFAPSMQQWEGFDLAYRASFPIVRPPCCVFAETSSEDSLRVEILTAPSLSIGRDVLHVESVSCWVAATDGPQALSNRVTLSEWNERRTVSVGCALVPTTLRLAVAADLPGLVSAPLHDWAAKKAIPVETLQDFVAQFAFMYANGVIGFTHFGAPDASSAATHATFFLRDMRLAPLLPSLWKWCTDGTSALTPWSFTKEGTVKASVMCRVIAVTGLPRDAMIQVLLERRVPLEED